MFIITSLLGINYLNMVCVLCSTLSTVNIDYIKKWCYFSSEDVMIGNSNKYVTTLTVWTGPSGLSAGLNTQLNGMPD